MRKSLIAFLLVVIATVFAMPEATYSHPRPRAHRHKRHKQVRRADKRSTWAPIRRPRRHWRDQRRGPYVKVGFIADFVFESDSDLTQIINTGLGGDLAFGIRMTDRFALELGGLLSAHGTDSKFTDSDGHSSALLGGLTMDGKFFFLPGSKTVEPFLALGLGYYWVWESNNWSDLALHGFGYNLGGGLDLRISRVLTVGLGAFYTGMFMYTANDFKYSQYYQDDYAYMNHITAEIALKLHF